MQDAKRNSCSNLEALFGLAIGVSHRRMYPVAVLTQVNSAAHLCDSRRGSVLYASCGCDPISDLVAKKKTSFDF